MKYLFLIVMYFPFPLEIFMATITALDAIRNWTMFGGLFPFSFNLYYSIKILWLLSEEVSISK